MRTAADAATVGDQIYRATGFWAVLGESNGTPPNLQTWMDSRGLLVEIRAVVDGFRIYLTDQLYQRDYYGGQVFETEVDAQQAVLGAMHWALAQRVDAKRYAAEATDGN